MKKQIIIMFIISILTFSLLEMNAEAAECPKPSNLEKMSLKDKEEFLKALNTLVPVTYEKGEFAEKYTKWEVRAAIPFTDTVGNKQDEIYYAMAKNFCGKEVADKSWLARLYFPKWEGISASASEGQLFIAKSKEKGWFVWFRYH